MPSVLVVTPDDRWVVKPLPDTDGRLLKALQAEVGGYIEQVTGDGWAAILNEDGKLIGLPVNERATVVLDRMLPGFASHDVAVGTVLFLGTDGRGGYNDVPAAMVEQLPQDTAAQVNPAKEWCLHCGREIRLQVGPGHMVHVDFDPETDVDDRTSLVPHRHNAAMGGQEPVRSQP